MKYFNYALAKATRNLLDLTEINNMTKKVMLLVNLGFGPYSHFQPV